MASSSRDSSTRPCFVDIVHTHRGWTSLPANQRMPPEEPIYACAMPCMAVARYAVVDWAASDIIMLRPNHRAQLEQVWFDTCLMRYSGPWSLPRPLTEEELKIQDMHCEHLEAEQLAELLEPRKTGVVATDREGTEIPRLPSHTSRKPLWLYLSK